MKEMLINHENLTTALESRLRIGTVHIKVSDVMDWDFGATRETLRSALVDAAIYSGVVHIPEQFRDTWSGEVSLDGDRFLITISAPVFNPQR